MKRMALVSAASALCVLAGGAVAFGGALGGRRAAGADERVRLEDCPPAVRRTIQAHLNGGTLVEIERTTDHGRVLYEVDVRQTGGIVEFDVGDDGEFVGEEHDDEEGEDEEHEHAEPEGEEDEHEHDQDRVGLEAATPPREREVLVPTPLAEHRRFSAVIDHPYMPLSEVRLTELASEDGERVVREVLDETREVGGVECLVLAEKEYEDGELVEISYNFFAQDEDGNVFYFGEDVDDYEGGRVVGHGGAWLVGRNATEPCLFLPGDLQGGMTYKPENSPPEAEEWACVGTVDGELAVEGLTWDDVLVVLETDEDDRWTGRKFYVRGVGLVSENETLNLVDGERFAGVDDEDEGEEDEDEGEEDEEGAEEHERRRP